MTDLRERETAEKLETYCAARNIEPRSAEHRQLLLGLRHNKQFGELLDAEIARLATIRER